MFRDNIGIFLVALTTLMTELVLIRIFDVVLTPNLGYMVITCAMFAYGLAGILVVLRPEIIENLSRKTLSTLAFVMAASLLAIRPVMNSISFDPAQIVAYPLESIAGFSIIYLAIFIPFFLSGLLITLLISANPGRIRTLYFWDLTGAALGCVILLPFLPAIGPGGLLLFGAGLALFISGVWSTRYSWIAVTTIAGVAVILVPLVKAPAYYEFKTYTNKPTIQATKEEGGKIVFSRWDPVSKIDVYSFDGDTVDGEKTGSGGLPFKGIIYDGGSQGTMLHAFDGDYEGLREKLDQRDGEAINNNFWSLGHLVSHYLKRDSDQNVMIIGSAGGQETKAALTYGAAHVDAVEMVGTVVDLGKNVFPEYSGNLFNHEKVDVYVGEGRSVLRSSTRKYDIIQIYSNHTTSTIAAGSGAVGPVYLQTAEAYREYFEHLTDNGLLHINHYGYPRMITTAALAWQKMGRTDFQKHVAVFELGKVDHLPLMLVKMQPWTHRELAEVTDFLSTYPHRFEDRYKLVENPLKPDESYLIPEFYSGDVSPGLVDSVDYRITPATDNNPYFSFFRKKVGILEPDPSNFVSTSMAAFLNGQVPDKRFSIFTMDTIHILVTGFASVVFASFFIFIPLIYSKAGRAPWSDSTGYLKTTSLIYFASLGGGFIILELVFIQIFMHFIGAPLHTYATVIFTMLLAAGIGSFSSGSLGIGARQRWAWPFIGVLLIGTLLVFTHARIFPMFLSEPASARILISAAMLFPLGFFLGMPFPLGISILAQQPRGAIAWAWGLNGFFTVTGGFASVIMSLSFGFRFTLLFALFIYLIAFWCMSKMRQSELEAIPPDEARSVA